MKRVTTLTLIFLMISLCALSLVACTKLYNPWEGTPHEHLYLKRIIAPTCTDDGYDLRYCADCSSSYKENIVPALSEDGHNFEGYVCTRCYKLDGNAPATDLEDLIFNPIYADAQKNETVGYEIAGCINDELKYLKIPSKYKDKPVIRVGAEAFYNNLNLYYIELPDCITSIGREAFWFSGIREINFPKDLRTIEFSAFMNCHSIESVVFNEGLQNIADGAFDFCMSLRSVSISDTVTDIDIFAFCRCEKLEEVYIGKGLSSLSQSLFENCTGLKKVYLPSSVSFAYTRVFQGCDGLEIIYDGTVSQWAGGVGLYIVRDKTLGNFKVVCADGTIEYNNRVIEIS